jgi:hypothetical protein
MQRVVLRAKTHRAAGTDPDLDTAKRVREEVTVS